MKNSISRYFSKSFSEKEPPRTFGLAFSWVILAATLTLSLGANAVEPTFEAYQKFYLGGKHCGFAIQRYDFDDKKKEVTSISYQYVKFGEHTTIESLVAKSDLNFEPISYHYTAVIDNKPVAIDATFKNKKMTGTMIDGKVKKALKADVPPNGFLSTFLNYVLLKNGLSVGKGYDFRALSEEDGVFRQGSAQITEETKIEKVAAYKIKFNFKTEFTALLSDKGEALGTLAEAQNASTEIAPKDKAIAGIQFNEKQIRDLFGNIPAGVNNQLYGKGTTTTAATPTAPTKSQSLMTAPPTSANKPSAVANPAAPKDQNGH